jgi:hypothetical protein
MLSIYSVLMMLLLGTGSIVGISSIYTPANVETQPQQQPQPQPLPQPQKPQTTIPGLKMPQSKIELGQQIADQNALRAIQDKQLLDRLMPQIIKRIDVKLVLTQRPGGTGEVKPGNNPLTAGTAVAGGKAGCPPGETAVSAGFDYSLGGGTDQSIWKFSRIPNSNTWDLLTRIDDGYGKFFTYAECLKVELSLKGAQQPQPQQPQPQQPSQQQPPAQPPGGPPLQPPPEFGRK